MPPKQQHRVARPEYANWLLVVGAVLLFLILAILLLFSGWRFRVFHACGSDGSLMDDNGDYCLYDLGFTSCDCSAFCGERGREELSGTCGPSTMRITLDETGATQECFCCCVAAT